MTSPELGARGGQILVVCTGNICRSPFVERMLRASLPGSFEVTSAGTAALVGEPMDPEAAERLRRHGGDSEGFVARQLTALMVAGADLVLTATRAHRAAVASLQPSSLPYLFTLGDFSDLAAGAEITLTPLPEASRVAQVTRVVADRRGLVPPRDASDVDIVDPYRRHGQVFDAMAQGVLASLPPVLRLLTGQGS